MNVEFTVPAAVNSEWDDTGLSDVLIALSRNDVTRIIKLAKAAKKLKVLAIHDWDEPFQYLGPEEEEIEFRSEISEIVVMEDCFYYEGIVKHTESHWDTERTPITLLEEVMSVWNTPDSELPLLVGTLKTEQAQQVLEERLKEE